MPRVYIRKTTRAQIDLSKYKNAYNEVKAGSSLRSAAMRHGLNYSSLSRYIRKRDTSADGENLLMGYAAHNRVFNDEQERDFLEYLISRIDINFGLTKNEVRKLAYEFTVMHNLSRPRPWDDNGKWEALMNFLKHFKKYTRVSPSSKVLLILESQYTDIPAKTLDFCKGNGIVLLSFPQHCSHRHQPLYQTTFDPLKEAVNMSCDVWKLNHPGKEMSIYDIPRIVASTTLIALTPLKIQAGFRISGFYPYSPQMFTEFDFASVTNTNNKNEMEEEITLKLNVQPDDTKSPLSPLNNLPIVKTEEEENFDNEP